MIIRLIIQTILVDPSGGVVWTESGSNVSSLDPSGAIQIDVEHPTRNWKVAYSVLGWLLLGLAQLAVRGRVKR